MPSNYLETELWLESDRLGWLLDALDIAKLNAQRDIVKNERRQSYDNRPYGRVGEIMDAELYPEGHPYHWPVIGSMTDLSAASDADVKAFYNKWYGPNNTVLVIAGDFNPAADQGVGAEVLRGDPARPGDHAAGGARRTSRRRRSALSTKTTSRSPELFIEWPGVGVTSRPIARRSASWARSSAATGRSGSRRNSSTTASGPRRSRSAQA